MSETTNMHRRTFLAGQAGLMCLASPAIALTATPKWETATYDQYRHHVGETFTAWNEDGRKFRLKLAEVTQVKLGPGRPASLMRQAGVTLIFDSPAADEIATQGGSAMLKVRSQHFGTSSLYFDTERLASGKHRFELHFN